MFLGVLFWWLVMSNYYPLIWGGLEALRWLLLKQLISLLVFFLCFLRCRRAMVVDRWIRRMEVCSPFNGYFLWLDTLSWACCWSWIGSVIIVSNFWFCVWTINPLFDLFVCMSAQFSFSVQQVWFGSLVVLKNWNIICGWAGLLVFLTSTFFKLNNWTFQTKNSLPSLVILCYCRYPFGRTIICNLKPVYPISLGLSLSQAYPYPSLVWIINPTPLTYTKYNWSSRSLISFCWVPRIWNYAA